MVGKLVLSFFLGALLLGGPLATNAWASHNGPVIFVDDDNPVEDDTDGDYHFHSLKAVFEQPFPGVGENDLIVVDPGTYEGNITIGVKGVVLKASEGRDLTKFTGSITITGKEVQVIGFDVDATGQSAAFVVQNDNVLLQDNKAHNANAAGIVVESGSDGVQLMGNEVFNNGTEGIHVRGDSDNAVVQKNQARSNGAIGVFISDSSDRAVVQENDVSLNQSEGIKVQDADFAEIDANSVFNNALDGIRLEGANDGVVLNNTIRSSGGFGVSVVDADNNVVRQNTSVSNDGGGIALRGSQGSSKRNIVDENAISGNIRAGSEGILLQGDVSSNVILGNTVTNNSFGMRFLATSSGEAPSSNVVDKNSIKDSPEDGIEVAGSAGRNQIKNNVLSGNNKVGIRANNGNGNDEFFNNQIFNNGHQGILLDGSPRNNVSNNELRDNGREGVALINGASNNSVSANSVVHNRSHGISVASGSDSNDVEGNSISDNRQDGIQVDGAAQLDVRENAIEANVGLGLSLTNATGVDVENNLIRNNNAGGVYVEASSVVDIEQNNIHDNTQFGLTSVGSSRDLKADRNWWGAAQGPAGVFEGVGNAALGVDVTQVFPWLTAPFDQLMLGSTTGEIIDDFGVNDAVDFLATDKADVAVHFFQVNAEEDGMIIASKYEAGKPDALSSLRGAIKAVSLLVSGLNSGTTLINVKYDDSEVPAGASKETLRLFYFNGSQWVQLSGRSRTNVNIVEGEIAVQALKAGVIIAMAPGGN